ncbi:MAG: tetratricopeptide repeat protein, partial [Planctomycetota bacterium]
MIQDNGVARLRHSRDIKTIWGWHTLESAHELGVIYRLQNRYDSAEKLLFEAVKGRHLKLGDSHPHTLESWHNLIALYE